MSLRGIHFGFLKEERKYLRSRWETLKWNMWFLTELTRIRSWICSAAVFLFPLMPYLLALLGMWGWGVRMSFTSCIWRLSSRDWLEMLPLQSLMSVPRALGLLRLQHLTQSRHLVLADVMWAKFIDLMWINFVDLMWIKSLLFLLALQCLLCDVKKRLKKFSELLLFVEHLDTFYGTEQVLNK